jgi:SEL1 protein
MQRHKLTLSLLIFSLLPLSLHARQYFLILSQEDLKDIPSSPTTTSSDVDPNESPPEWDEFGDSDSKPEHELDPGSWRPIFEPDATTSSTSASKLDPEMEQYYSAVEKMFSAVSDREVKVVEEAVAEIEELATVKGNSHAQSVLGFLYGLGQIKERDKAKAFLYHHFAADGGSLQSKSALAYTYYRQQVS